MHGVTRAYRLLEARACLSNGLVLSTRSSRQWKWSRNVHTTIPSLTTESSSIGSDTNTINEIFESSSHAKWMTDASSLADLPPQGDLASMGLGGYSPVGLLQTSLEWIHLTTGLPWWGSIIACTFVLRMALFPIAVKLQGNAARMNNIRPEMDRILAKIKQHQQMGNGILAAQESARLMTLYKEHKCNPLKMMIMPFLQIPIFISFFIAVRRMATAPVESMKSGGALWFTDLTIPDPYYVLPFASCLSFLITIEMGGEAGVTNPQVEKMKIMFRAMAILLIPVTATFPSGLFMYWLTASLFSMGQILLLKVPSVRSSFGIPKVVKHPTPSDDGTGRPGSGLMKKFKESYRSSVLIDEAKRRESSAKKKYNQQLKDTSPKLYNEPPHKRGT